MLTVKVIETDRIFSDKIMEMIKELFNYTGINIKKEHWNTYDEMNKIIIFIDLRD